MKNKNEKEVIFWRQKIIETIFRITDVSRLRTIRTIAQSIENSPAFEEEEKK